MTQPSNISRVICTFVMGTLIEAGLCGQSRAVLVYQQNFDNADGVPVVTPGGGTLAVNASASFAATGGVSGGVLNSNTPSSLDSPGLAASTLAGGSAISGLGTLSQFTIMFWFKVDAYRTSGGTSRDHRLAILGTSTAPGDIGFIPASANM